MARQRYWYKDGNTTAFVDHDGRSIFTIEGNYFAYIEGRNIYRIDGSHMAFFDPNGKDLYSPGGQHLGYLEP